MDSCVSLTLNVAEECCTLGKLHSLFATHNNSDIAQTKSAHRPQAQKGSHKNNISTINSLPGWHLLVQRLRHREFRVRKTYKKH